MGNGRMTGHVESLEAGVRMTLTSSHWLTYTETITGPGAGVSRSNQGSPHVSIQWLHLEGKSAAALIKTPSINIYLLFINSLEIVK